MRFENYIERYRTNSARSFNFQSLAGGVYNFPDKLSFFKGFLHPDNGYRSFCKNYCTSMVFKPRKDLKMPLYYDFDFKMKEQTNIPTSAMVELSREIFKIMGKDPPKFLITRRCVCYYKTTKSEQYWASGFHLWVFGQYSTPKATELRLKCLEARVLDSFLERYNIYNSPSDAFDQSPAIRSNGLIIVGDRKPKVDCSPHFIAFYSIVGELDYGWELKNHSLFTKLLSKMYDFIWKEQKNVKTEPPKICKPAPHQDEEKQICPPKSASQFNLNAFLEATQGYTPSNAPYKQLCSYFASQGLDAIATCDMCNKYWGYTTRETETLINKAVDRNDFRVTRASVISILQVHGIDWDEDEIFGKPEELYYNDLQKFSMSRGNAWGLKEIKSGLQNTFSFVWGKKTEMFVYKEQFFHRSDDFKQTDICVTGLMPFSKSKSDMFVLVKPTLLYLLSILKKMKRPRVPKCPRGDSAQCVLDEYKELSAEYKKQFEVYRKSQALLKKKNVTVEEILQVVVRFRPGR